MFHRKKILNVIFVVILRREGFRGEPLGEGFPLFAPFPIPHYTLHIAPQVLYIFTLSLDTNFLIFLSPTQTFLWLWMSVSSRSTW